MTAREAQISKLLYVLAEDGDLRDPVAHVEVVPVTARSRQRFGRCETRGLSLIVAPTSPDSATTTPPTYSSANAPLRALEAIAKTGKHSCIELVPVCASISSLDLLVREYLVSVWNRFDQLHP